MSASLVGSEMCIRDRRTPAAIRWWGGPRRAMGGGRPPPPRDAGPAGALGCLLYTSDAADDM
eukprot:9677503-Alexandrium_andersonii.AAC.1